MLARTGRTAWRWSRLACLGVAAVLSGCHHQRVQPMQPAVLTAPDKQPPTPLSPPMPSPPPDTISTAPPVKVTPAKPKRTAKKSAPKMPPPEAPAPAPTDAAGTPPTPAHSIGALSAGSDADPKNQQAAAELIASCEHRLAGLPQSTVEKQQAQVRNVRHFVQQAKEALGMGDADGAMTLAMKAKLLLDDLTAP